MSYHKKRLTTVILCTIAFVCPVHAEDSETFTLKNDTLRVTINPSTLQVVAETNSKQEIQLSARRHPPEVTFQTKVTDTSATWRLPRENITVLMSLSGNELSVLFRSSKPGSFTWPVMDHWNHPRAIIWPSWEGRYIPLDDYKWGSYLKHKEWDTLEGLSMPFWGFQTEKATATFIITNRFNNTITFETGKGMLSSRFTHEFPKSKKNWEYGFLIHISDSTSPIESAQVFRQWLIRKNKHVPMTAKIKQTPRAAWLLGSPHFYLWGDDLLSHHDIKRPQWQNVCKQLVEQAKSDTPSVGKRIQTLMTPDHWKEVEEITTLEWPHKYIKSQVCTELNRLLQKPDFYDDASWKKIKLPAEAKQLLAKDRSKLSIAERSRLNALLLYAAYPDAFLPVDQWSNGASTKMLDQLKQAGLKRARLCLAGWEGVEKHPDVARYADQMGYLFGTYDSFHSIHDPALKGTDSSWTTAQFDQKLFDTGGITREDGTKRGGFKQRGYLLSPHGARSHVEARVNENFKNVLYNHYFIDCDAYGQVFDDYSPLHPSTQQQDADARADRMAWIDKTFKVVIGSEGGCSYFAPVIHIAEGMFTPVIGWGDSDMKDKNSEYFIGRYYPPEGPTIFTKPSKLKDHYVYYHYDPRFRLPLNEVVFHDSFVSTHHWGNPSLKFTNVRDTVALTEMLYLCPPMYHLNLDEFKKLRDWIVKHNEFFYPIHSEFGFAPLTDFQWLTPDRLVQRTVFDDKLEMTANFSTKEYKDGETTIPPRSVQAKWLKTGKTKLFSPEKKE